ncbi:MAG: hypothetical protein IJK98_03720, partial [Clostridia bacterium]|nr:hypothetical protein [Clostridia bacterium]
MKRQNTFILRRALAVLLSVVMALTMALPAFARGGDTAELYTDDLGNPAVNIPVTGTAALDLTDKPAGFTFKVYDDGGRTGNCDHVAKDGYLLVTAPEGFIMQVSGSFNLKFTEGEISFGIYDGGDTSSDPWTMSNLEWAMPRDMGVFVSSGNKIVVNFKGLELYTCAGLDFTVTLAEAASAFGVNVAAAAHASVTPAADTYQVGATAVLNVDVDPGYALTGIWVKDANGDNILPFFPHGYEVNTADFFGTSGTMARFDPRPLWYGGTDNVTFTMPASDVTVTYETKPIAEGLSIDLPAEGWGQISIPETVQSFKLYDAGGADGAMPNDGRTDVTATLTAPEGFRVQVSGSIDVYPRDDCDLTLYDGATARTPELVHRTGTDETGDIGTVTSTGRNMFLFFYNRPDEEPYDGLDLTVTLIPDDAYGLPDWSWAADLSSATAVFTSGSKSVELVDVSLDVVYTTEPTCTADGIGYYEATVTFGGADYTCASDDVTIPDTATGHSYGEPVWSWAEDLSSATATFTCEKGDNSFIMNDPEPVKELVEEAGCLTDATVKYVATVNYNGIDYISQSSAVADEGTALGHDYQTEWTWFSRTQGSLRLTCSRCDYVEQVPFYSESITEQSVTAPTVETDGSVVCVADVTNAAGVPFSDTHSFVIPKIGGHLVLGANTINPQETGWQNAVVCDFTPAV